MPQSARHVSLPELAGSWPITKIGGSPQVMPNTTETNATILGVVREPSDGYDVDSSSFFVWVDGTRYTASFAYGGAKLPLSEVVSQINTTTGLSLATDDNGFVRLTSPTAGDGSTLRLEHNSGSPKVDVLYRLGFFPETFAYSGDIRQAQHVDPERQVAMPGQMFMTEGESLTPGVFNRALFQLALNNDRNEGLLSRKQITADATIPTHAYSSPGTPEGYQFTGDKYVFVGDTVTPTEAELERLAAVLDAEGRELVKEVTAVETAAIPALSSLDSATGWEAITATSGTPFSAIHATGNYYIVSTEWTGGAAVLNGVPLKIVKYSSATRVLIAAVDPATGDKIDLQPSGVNVDLVSITPYRAKVTGIYDSQGGSRVEGVKISKRTGIVPGRVERNNRVWVGTASFTNSPAVEIGDLVHWSGLSGQEPFSNNGTYRVIAIPDRHTLELANEDWSSAFLNADLSGGAGTFDVESDGLFYKDPFFEFAANGAPESGDQIQILYRGRSTIREVTDDPTALLKSRLFDQEADDTVQKAILRMYGPSAETMDDVLYGDARMNLETINYRFDSEHEDEDGRHTYITCYDVLPRSGGLYDSGSSLRPWNEIFTEKLSLDGQDNPESSLGIGIPYKGLGAYHKDLNQTANTNAHMFGHEVGGDTGGPFDSAGVWVQSLTSSSGDATTLWGVWSESDCYSSQDTTWAVAYGGASYVYGLANGDITNAAVFRAYDGGKLAGVGTGNVLTYYGLRVDTITGGTTNNYGIYVQGASGGSGRNYAIWTDSGYCRFDGPVMMGTDDDVPLGQAHVRTGDSGVSSLDANFDDFVVESGVNCGITLTCPTDHRAGVVMTDANGTYRGFVIYDHGETYADNLFIGTVGTTRLRINASGYVGIGTNVNATSMLHVVDPTDLSPNASGTGHFQISGNAYAGFITLDAAAMWTGHNSGSRGLGLMTDETSRLYITAVGNVGVGTTTPDTLFHVEGDADPAIRITSKDPLEGAGGSENIAQIQFEGQQNNLYRVGAYIRARQNGTWSTTTSNIAPTAITFHTQDSSATDSKATERLTINQVGFVGINNSSPLKYLDVVGDNGIAEGSPSIHASYVALFRNNGATADQSRVSIIAGTTGDSILAFGDKDDAQKAYISYDHEQEYMLLSSNSTPVVGVYSTGIAVGGGYWHDAQAPVHVHEGSYGGGGPHSSSGMAIEDDADTYFSFVTPNTAESGFFFGDPEDNNVGRIIYDHSTTPNELAFWTDAATRMVLSSSGLVVGPSITTPLDSAQLNLHGEGAKLLVTSSSETVDAVLKLADSAALPDQQTSYWYDCNSSPAAAYFSIGDCTTYMQFQKVDADDFALTPSVNRRSWLGTAGLGWGNLYVDHESVLTSGAEAAATIKHSVTSDTGNTPYGLDIDVSTTHTTGSVSSVYGARIFISPDSASGGNISSAYCVRAGFYPSGGSKSVTNVRPFSCGASFGLASPSTFRGYTVEDLTGSVSSTHYGFFTANTQTATTTVAQLKISQYVAALDYRNAYSIWAEDGFARFDNHISPYFKADLSASYTDESGIVVQAKNVSGLTISQYSLVTFASSPDANTMCVSTSTTANDPSTCGVSLDSSSLGLQDDETGPILLWGVTPVRIGTNTVTAGQGVVQTSTRGVASSAALPNQGALGYWLESKTGSNDEAWAFICMSRS